jgi:hypothetical protein
MDDALIERAKAWARRRGVSLSQVVASVLEQIPSRRARSPLSPWTAGLVGLARPRKGQSVTDAALRETYLDHVAEHHR